MLQLTTELEAVNTMLMSIGESPVNTLDNPGVVDESLKRSLATCLEVPVGGGAHGDFVLCRTTSPEQDTQLDAMASRDPMAPDYDALGSEPLPQTATADSRESAAAPAVQ